MKEELIPAKLETCCHPHVIKEWNETRYYMNGGMTSSVPIKTNVVYKCFGCGKILKMME